MTARYTAPPAPVLCAGTPAQMGHAQGLAGAASLRRMDATLLEVLSVSGGAWEHAAPWLLRGFGRTARALLEPPLERHLPHMGERLRGMARGAGIPIDHLYGAPAIELLFGRVFFSRPGACTALAVTGPRSVGGTPVLAKNFDYPTAAWDTYLVRRSAPAGRLASLDVTVWALPGSHEGINEAGLAVTYNYGFFSGKPQARLPITFLVQELLESCRTVEEAVARLGSLPRTGGAMLMLADDTGAIASVELGPDRMAVRHGDVGWLAHTNHAQTAELAPTDIPHDAVYARPAPKLLRGTRVHASSEARLERATALLGGRAPLGLADLRAFLADHSSGVPSDDTICRHGPMYLTTCSVVLQPRQRALQVAFGPPCQAEFATFQL